MMCSKDVSEKPAATRWLCAKLQFGLFFKAGNKFLSKSEFTYPCESPTGSHTEAGWLMGAAVSIWQRILGLGP